MQIKDLKVKEVQTIQVLIKSVNVAKNAAQKSYLRFEFVDQTGTIFANKWSVKPEEITLFHPGQVVKVKGLIQLYNTQKQINIETVEPVEGDLDISKYVMASAYPADVLKSNIETFVNQMQEGYYKNIVNAFLSKYETEFYRHPAASRMHHAFISGLAQHVYEMLKIAAVYCDMYEMLNRELVYAGIILHDMGKLFEMTCENLVSTEYTLEGLMVGHISMMVSLIDEMSKELECEGEESI
ncbi:HD domain-containing protein, partial [Turicibacter sanguinis]|nr:HD domain-containing protein [Turicibacter sanguinis]